MWIAYCFRLLLNCAIFRAQNRQESCYSNRSEYTTWEIFESTVNNNTKRTQHSHPWCLEIIKIKLVLNSLWFMSMNGIDNLYLKATLFIYLLSTSLMSKVEHIHIHSVQPMCPVKLISKSQIRLIHSMAKLIFEQIQSSFISPIDFTNPNENLNTSSEEWRRKSISNFIRSTNTQFSMKKSIYHWISIHAFHNADRAIQFEHRKWITFMLIWTKEICSWQQFDYSKYWIDYRTQ